MQDLFLLCRHLDRVLDQGELPFVVDLFVLVDEQGVRYKLVVRSHVKDLESSSLVPEDRVQQQLGLLLVKELALPVEPLSLELPLHFAEFTSRHPILPLELLSLVAPKLLQKAIL